MIYYTADLHFDYLPILADRPFDTLEEMNETLIRNWNERVSHADTVYVLGDLGGHGQPIPEACLERLNGKKHLIRGNHDVGLGDQQLLYRFFETVSDFLETEDEGLHVLLSHYPMVYIQRGYMIHGHLHGVRKEAYELLKQLPRVQNACVDIHGFAPVTLRELIANNQHFYQDPDRGRIEDWMYQKKSRWRPDFHPLPRRDENAVI